MDIHSDYSPHHDDNTDHSHPYDTATATDTPPSVSESFYHWVDASVEWIDASVSLLQAMQHYAKNNPMKVFGSLAGVSYITIGFLLPTIPAHVTFQELVLG